ncbi:kinase-like domain-containing protein [Rhizophagus irregularis DAOM 181602=DAOM 197198]|uniref:Kinase-like domain-containing protein n=1 Tax=Rhizophagus irregularis (strain DAOM 181602 / DAOM 197198 / MUCL 43194) TaxID=747089 RepID=A0A2P4Q8L1_RHIID|nr:kinase-like domain-containing protein [Rhizophagus irregularis DAOM 181602=DAOM 197198]POG73983.1 kinase-like domain-containing protein [Rhizophagus irregularis DAOM 181602=DAOM 197198]|eukprot:XP_025180849.1 kinase-like domain-containing protein [Rhizophagus irregularis DAOM 181602=DAOM 197198]
MAQSNDKVSSSTEEFEVKKFEEWYAGTSSFGGFGTIYKAIWKDENKVVVLKSFNNSMNENSNDFLNEWKYHQSLGSYQFIKLYGFTKDPDTSDYLVIMDYANQGNLRGNLTIVVNYDWKQKLRIIYKIILGLNYIHQQNLMHCDLHDGNVLNHKDTNEYKVYISDLGLCRPVKSFFKKDDIYGVIPFMAPEVLRGKPYTLASDIYSFSMIMWEFTSGVPPFNDREHDLPLSLSICRGERPEITENTPQCYVDLMKKCWDEDPLKRPSSEEVLNTFRKWIFIPDQTEIKDIDEELKSQIMEFINAPIEHKNPVTKFHSQACYTSRLLNFTSEKLNDILKSECLDCIVSDMNSLDVKSDKSD